MLSLYRYLYVFGFLILGSSLQAQTCLPTPLGSDVCSAAPLMSCNLDGYMGTSSGYSPPSANGENDPNDFCGLVENDQYFRFIVDELPVIIQVVPSSCTTAKGLQAIFYKTTDCMVFDASSVCGSFGFQNQLNLISDGDVAIGDELYLMIDGFEGDVCDFTINVVSGIVSEVEAMADNTEICLGNQITLDGTSSTTGANVEYLWTTSNGNIVSGENTLEPVIDAVGDYTLTVVNVEECCTDDITISVTENTDTPTFNFDASYVVTCTDPSLTLDPGLANPNDYDYSWTTSDGAIDPGSAPTDAAILVNSAGTYTLDIVDTNTQCDYTIDVLVTADNSDPDVMATSTNNLDCNNASTTIEAQSSVGGLMYSWEGPNSFVSSASSFSASDAGTYMVTITAANGCTNTSDVMVSSTGNPDANIAKQRDLDCTDTDTRLTGSSTTAGVTYAWTGPNGPLGSMSEIIVADSGLYTLVVSLPNGCSTTTTEMVLEDTDLPNVSAAVSNELDCTTTSATLEGASTTAGAIFSWVGPNGFTSNMAQPTTSDAGAYTLTVTAPNGCTDNIMVNVMQDATAPTADAGGVQSVDCNTPTTTVGGSNTSVGPDFSYEWTVDADPTVIGTDPTLPVSTGGMYTLTVTSLSNSCTSVSTVQVNEDKTPPTADAGPNAFLTCSMRSVDLGGTSSTGAEFTYEWADDTGNIVSTDAVYNTTLIGNYTLTVRNTSTGCTEVDVVDVDEDPYTPIAAVPNTADITCASPMTDLESTGSTSGPGIEYEWYDNNNTLISTDPNTQVGTPGSYRLVVIDTNVGCTDSILVRVDENVTPPLGSAGVDMSIDCSTNQVTLEGSVAGNVNEFTFEWFDDAGQGVGTDMELTTNIAGQYDLVITNIVNGCTRQSFAIVTDDRDLPDVDAGSPEIITCFDPQVMIGGTNSSTGSNISYEWFDSAGDLVGNTEMIQVDNDDTYQLVVTNVGTSCSATESVVVSRDQVDPQAATNTPASITCFDPTSVLDASTSSAANGSLAYEWTDPNGTMISNMVNADATIAGDYTLTVMDLTNGCENTTTVTVVTDTIAPTVEVTNPEIITCYQNFVEVNYNSVNGPITPVWTDINGNVLSTEESYLATQIGVVVLEATDQSNGCVSTAAIDIVEDKVAPEASIAIPEVLTCSVLEANLVPTITNFSTEAMYSWTNNAGDILGQDANLAVDDDGTYTLEITNVSNGCTATFFSTVQEDKEDPVAVINNVGSRVDCYTPSIDIDATMSTGNAPLAYQWTNDEGTIISDQELFALTEGGQITLLVTNTVNNCTATTNVDIDEDLESPEVNFNPVSDLTCQDNEVTVESVVTGSNNSFAYTWEGPGAAGVVSGQNDPNAIVDLVGQYTLTVTDQINGCSSVAQVSVAEDRILPEVAVEPVSELNCVTGQVVLDATNSSSGSQFTYSWSGPGITAGQTANLAQVEEPGDYNLLIVNTETGCENNILVEVTENDDRPVGATLTMEGPTCFGLRDGVLDVSNVVGGAAPYIYSINSETNFTDISNYQNLPAGDYTLIVQDDIGCQWDTIFQMIEPEEVTADLGSDQIIRLGEDIELFVETSGNVVSIAWTDNGEAGPIDVTERLVEPVRTTTYVVVVSNEDGCIGTDNVVVEVEDDRRVYFPNAFSPNNDGINDFFTVFTDIATQEVTSLQIFDKWGNQVFEKNNFMPNIPQEGWDGSYRGQQMPLGTYVYSAFIEFKNGNKINFKGEINIVY